MVLGRRSNCKQRQEKKILAQEGMFTPYIVSILNKCNVPQVRYVLYCGQNSLLEALPYSCDKLQWAEKLKLTWVLKIFPAFCRLSWFMHVYTSPQIKHSHRISPCQDPVWHFITPRFLHQGAVKKGWKLKYHPAFAGGHDWLFHIL